MEFDIPVNTNTRLIYLKKELVKILGEKCKAIPDGNAVLFFNANTQPEDLIESLDLIKATVVHAAKIKNGVKHP
jgi:hypothetical protein